VKKVLVQLVLAALLMSACGSGSDHAGHTGAGDDHSPGSMQHGGSVPGVPAGAGDADREITVIASDDLSFDPASMTVSAGEVVTFVVNNEGKTEHEFVLGDEAYQDMHQQDMAEGDHHMSGMDNAVVVPPGETIELTWRFDEPGEVLYGCHEPGHYDGGMVGTVEVG
jgi:uncharacterized cupredoxin-like copper-binding protein